MNRLCRRVAAVAAALVVLAGLASVGSATASSAPAAHNYTPHTYVHFQYPTADPRSTKANHEVVADTLETQFGAINSSWNVYLTMFNLVDSPKSGNDVVDRLLASITSSRAAIHVVLDDVDAPGLSSSKHPSCSGSTSTSTPAGWQHAAARLWCIATVNGTQTQRFITCRTDCINNTGNGIQHSKIALFAGPKAADRVVFSSSANWTPSQLADRYQTLVTVRDDNALYHSFRLYWNSLALHHTHVPPNYNGKYHDVYYFPNTTDPQLAALKKMDCARGGSVRYRSNNFNNATLAKQLVAMHRAGCTVRILVNRTGIQYAYPGVSKVCVDNLHQKDLVLSGKYSGGTPDLSVFTGSRPFGPGYRTSADENIRLRGQYWVDRFTSNYDSAYRLGKHDCANK